MTNTDKLGVGYVAGGATILVFTLLLETRWVIALSLVAAVGCFVAGWTLLGIDDD